VTRLLLASKSAARRRVLEAAGVPFQAVDADLDEAALKAQLAHLDAPALAQALADAKALAVEATQGALVLGSDQVLELEDGTMLSKAASREELADQLRRMSGRTHRLHSAAAIAQGRKIVWRGTESVALAMRPLSEEYIRAYLEAEFDEVRWSVGGDHVEGRGVQLFERIDGSHFAVLGMPLLPLLAYLRERGMLAS
jgi:septum formation protein